MARKLLFFTCFLLNLCILNAQNISGKVVDTESGKPLQNISVRMNENSNGDFTDEKGRFSIAVDTLPVRLIFSGIGFETLSLKIDNFSSALLIRLHPKTENLSEVLVKSTLIPDTLRKIPASISLISQAGLKQIDETNLAAAFNLVPGVYVNQGALNTTKLNIRGIGSRAQYETNRIQAFFNGIPLTTAEGELTLDDFDAETLDHIEVIKGPASSLYGAGLGGSINMYSKSAPDGTEVSVKSQAGSFNTFKEVLSASVGKKNFSIVSKFTGLQSDAYRENGNYDRKSAFLGSKIHISTADELNILAVFTHLKAYIPSSINEDDFKNSPSTAAYTWKAAKGYESYDKGIFGISNTYSFSEKFSNLTSVYTNFRNGYEPRPFDILQENRISTGIRSRFQYNFKIGEKEARSVFGAEFYDEWYVSKTFENLYEQFPEQGSVQGEILSDNQQLRNYANLFAQLKYSVAQNLKIEGGFNLNTTHYKLSDGFPQDSVDQSGNYRFKSIFSPRIAASYSLNPNQNLYVSISKGFSTPTVAETLTPEGLINTDIQPETGINYETGFKGNWLNKTLYTEVSLYSIQIKNLLVAKRVEEDRYVGINAGKTNHSGAEMYFIYNFNITPDFTVKPYFNASFNYFRFQDFTDNGNTYNGNKIPGTPEKTMNFGADVRLKNNLSLNINWFNSGKIPLNDANSGFSEGYSVVNVKAQFEKQIFSNFDFQLYAGVNNLFDEKYAAGILPNAVGFGGAAPRYYYPGNPVNYYTGIRLKMLF